MADQGKWFKLWISALNDPDLDNLSISDFGRWCKLGAYIKEQGENGKVIIHNPARSLCAKLQVESFDELINVTKQFPNCVVTLVTNGNVTYSIELENWHKYQGDYSTPRVYAMREKRKQSTVSTVTPQEEKRREEKRREKNIKTTAFIPPSVEEVQTYCKERNNGIDGAYWVDYYITRGWMVGKEGNKQKMKDWRAAVRTWERNKKESISDQYPDL